MSNQQLNISIDRKQSGQYAHVAWKCKYGIYAKHDDSIKQMCHTTPIQEKLLTNCFS